LKEGDIYSRAGKGATIPTSKDPNVAALAVANSKLEEMKDEFEKLT